MPKPPEEEQMLEGAGESHDPHTPRLTVRQRHGKLFDELDLNGLGSWAPELADAACQLLAEYHTIKLQMTLPLKNDLDKFPCHWLRRFRTTCGKCCSLVLSGSARVFGATQWCWCRRRMAVYSSALTFAV